MTLLDLQTHADSLRDDLTHGLINRRKFSRSALPQQTTDDNEEKADVWPMPKNFPTLTTKPRLSDAANAASGPVNLLTGMPFIFQSCAENYRILHS